MKSNTFFLCITLALMLIVFNSCDLQESVYSKENHLKTTKINDSLYSEIYFIRSILNADIERYSEYITDSVHFRKYVYTYNTGEWIYGEMSKSSTVLTIFKISGEHENNQTIFDTTKIETYNINELKREGKFE